jgi:putative hydrolase of the HAD superfamily
MTKRNFALSAQAIIKKIGSPLFLLICLVCFSAAAPTSEDPKPSIKAIVFDFGGVIADHDNTPLNTFMTTSLGVTEKEYKKIRKKWMKAQKAGMSERQYWEQYAASNGKTLDDAWFEQMHQAMKKTMLDIPGTLDIAKELKRQGYRVAMLSNVTTGHAHIRRQTGYYDLFDPLLLSCEIGVEKPDPKAYQMLLDALQLPPDQVLFIDDKKENIEAAQKLGIHAIQFKNAEQLEKDLQGFDINVSSVQIPVK